MYYWFRNYIIKSTTFELVVDDVSEVSEISKYINNNSFTSANSYDNSGKPNAVVEQFEKNEFELGVLIEKANNFMECTGLVFTKNRLERDSFDYKKNQSILLMVKNKLNEVNQQFREYDYMWEGLMNKNDELTIQEDFTTLKGKFLYKYCK